MSRLPRRYRQSSVRAFQVLERPRIRFLNIAVSFLPKCSCVVAVCTLPCPVVRRSKYLLVKGRPVIRNHRHSLADPHSMLLEIFLPVANLLAMIMIGEDQIGLHPWDSC